MYGKKLYKGFTLLEIIIVIIIVGVLASLALPRFFKVVEYSRSVEAITQLKVIRQAFERCYLMRGGGPGAEMACAQGSIMQGFPFLGVDDPSQTPNAHFDYSGVFFTSCGPAGTANLIMAGRNTRDLGGTDPGGSVTYQQCGSDAVLNNPMSTILMVWDNAGIRIYGSGYYLGLKQ